MIEKSNNTETISKNKDKLEEDVNALIKDFLANNHVGGINVCVDLVRSHPLKYEATVKAFV